MSTEPTPTGSEQNAPSENLTPQVLKTPSQGIPDLVNASVAEAPTVDAPCPPEPTVLPGHPAAKGESKEQEEEATVTTPTPDTIEAKEETAPSDSTPWKVVTTPTDGDFQIGNMWFTKSENSTQEPKLISPDTSSLKNRGGSFKVRRSPAPAIATVEEVNRTTGRRYSLDEVWKPVKNPAEGDFRIGPLWFRKSNKEESSTSSESRIKRSESLKLPPRSKKGVSPPGDTVEASKRRKFNLGEVWKPVKTPAEGDFRIGNLWFRKAGSNTDEEEEESSTSEPTGVPQLEPVVLVEEPTTVPTSSSSGTVPANTSTEA